MGKILYFIDILRMWILHRTRIKDFFDPPLTTAFPQSTHDFQFSTSNQWMKWYENVTSFSWSDFKSLTNDSTFWRIERQGAMHDGDGVVPQWWKGLFLLSEFSKTFFFYFYNFAHVKYGHPFNIKMLPNLGTYFHFDFYKNKFYQKMYW